LSIAVAAALVVGRDRRLPLRGGFGAVALAVAPLVLLAPLAARTWIRIGDWRDNSTLAAAVHHCHPRNLKVLIVLAEREAQQGRHGRARELYEEALSIRPDSSYAEAAMGVYLLERGELERAKALLDSCASRPDAVPGAVLRLALQELDRGSDDEASRLATRALEVGPSFNDAAIAHLVLGEVALRRRDVDEASRQYRRAIAENPREPAAHFNLGRVLEAQGRLNEALAELLAAESLSPSDPRILSARAVVEERLTKVEK
jgi:Tfp pilus assembly protein PilF